MNPFPSMSPSLPRRFFQRQTCLGALVVLLAFMLAGCGKKNAPAAQPAALEVDVVTVTTAPVAFTRELPGRTAARRIAQVRARVNGIVLRRLFTRSEEH
ncbi:MAG TPA: efflux transporter periplasmic adaptor subunit, partial [Nitrospira sp.]|nr:efflux transporter periplasmic adaptor subunit [Nitrospira sp.]